MELEGRHACLSQAFGPPPRLVWKGLVQSLQSQWTMDRGLPKPELQSELLAAGSPPVLLSKVPLVPQTPPAHNCLINEYVNESPAGSLPSRTPKASWISRETSAFLIPIGPAPGSRGTLPNQPPCFTVEETEAWGGASHMAGLGEAGMH